MLKLWLVTQGSKTCKAVAIQPSIFERLMKNKANFSLFVANFYCKLNLLFIILQKDNFIDISLAIK